MLSHPLYPVVTGLPICTRTIVNSSLIARRFISPAGSTAIIKSLGHVGSKPVPVLVTTKPLHLAQLLRVRMVTVQRRTHSTSEKKTGETGKHDHMVENSHVCRNGHGDEHDHDHDHDHSFSLFRHSHEHGEEHSRDAEQIIEALKGTGDRGSYITLVGLFTNVALTAAKGFAGWYMHSASLVADAGHSLSDLLGDFVTLFCWRLSRKPPSERYPYGFAKFESFGTSTISLLLIGGALGIGFHSYHLFIHALTETLQTLPPGTLYDILQFITETAPRVPQIGHGHVHAVDPNAAWFAALSVLTKEWLYRITKVVADEEKSPVLLANAVHHRSDAYSSLVAFFAIMGTWFFPAIPLDPLGGLLVSIVILQQGFGLFTGALKDLSDAGVSSRTKQSLIKALTPLTRTQTDGEILNGSCHHPTFSITSLRARHAGSLMFVDITATVSGSITVADMTTLEEKIEYTLKKARKEIKEVHVTFRPL